MLSFLVFLAAIALPFSNAQLYSTCDETVTQTLTQTHYTCPCDGASGTLVLPTWGQWELNTTSVSDTSSITTSRSSPWTKFTTTPVYINTTTTSTSSTATTTSAYSCPYISCIKSTNVPPSLLPSVSSYCDSLLITTAAPTTTTVILSSTQTVTVTPPVLNVTVSTTSTITTTDSILCTANTTVTTSASTFVEYPTYTPTSTSTPARRDTLPRTADLNQYPTNLPIPAFITSTCTSGLSQSDLRAACSCLVSPSTITPTTTTTTTLTTSVSTTLAQLNSTITNTLISTSTATTCTSTSTSTSTSTFPISCGVLFSATPTASTTGYITCTNTLPSPSLIARHRIEGTDQEGTIFEDCVASGPRNITTKSGGTHLCDGTNGATNPTPGTTITDQLDAASKLLGFGYDGTFDSTLDDFDITSISQSSQTATQFWGTLNNYQSVPAGGCQFEVHAGDSSVWAWNAFGVVGYLSVAPDYAVAEAGKGSVQVTVSTHNGVATPFQGATIAGQTSDSNGVVNIPVPSVPGCYQYKATASNHLRSNAFYLTVYDKFAGP